MIDLRLGDCLDVLKTLETASVDSVVTDPPAGIAFMNKSWDRNKGGRSQWVAWLCERLAEARRVAKPGAYMFCWALPRTSHWTGMAIEDAGWIVEDRIAHLFGSGFPKGKSRLKPACEDWWLARNPAKKIAPLNIDDCRVVGAIDPGKYSSGVSSRLTGWDRPWKHDAEKVQDRKDRSLKTLSTAQPLGRWPANVVHDGSPEVMEAFAEFGEKTSRHDGVTKYEYAKLNHVFSSDHRVKATFGYGDTGSAAKFFYCAKASRSDREDGNTHPTVKATELMRWLCRLVTPADGLVLDPFMGSGSTGKAAVLEDFRFLGIEENPDYLAIARRRIDAARDAMPLLTARAAT